MTIYSTLFFDESFLSAGAHTIYTVPENRIAVLRDATVFFRTDTANFVYLYNPSGAVIWASHSSGESTSDHFVCRKVYPAGTEINVYINDDDVDVNLSGYLFDAV